MGKVLLIQESKDIIVKACEDAICRAYNLGMIAGTDAQGTFSPIRTADPWLRWLPSCACRLD